MANKLDVLLFGASGYTGQFAILQLNKLAQNVKWGIAGRSESKMRKILLNVAKRADGNVNLSNIPIIVANVDNEETINKMTASTKVIINCCGPYDVYGEVVVKSCIETGTHYVDITGEIPFISRMLQKYNKHAEKKDVFIVLCCGFDSIPTDLGICFVENNFSGTINSVETYAEVFDKDVNCLSTINYGTWVSALNFVSESAYNMFASKKKPVNTLAFKPKLKIKLLTKYNGCWAVPIPICDAEVVNYSQQYFHQQYNKRPIQINTYGISPSFKYIVLCVFMSFLIGILVQVKFGKKLLLKYPEFFTCGLVTHNPPIENTSKTRFSIFLKCHGWGNKLPNPNDEYATPPNKEIIGCVSGINHAYGFTSLAVTLSALTILTEQQNLPSKGGVYTPATAFSKTTLIKQLQNNGVTFEVLSTKDI